MNTSELGDSLLAALAEKAWLIKRSPPRQPLLPPALHARYTHLPAEVSHFLASLASCANQVENAWFLCREDYHGTRGSQFRWNECEMMSLAAAGEDVEWQQQVRGFWDCHFPFMLAVHSAYDYLAVSLAEQTYGVVVHGCAPEFEEVSVIAPSFTDFLTVFRLAARAGGDYPLRLFL